MASLLDAVGPLSILGAQFVYVGQPVLSLWINDRQLEVFARLLEEPTKVQRFVTYLREVPAP